MSIPNQFPFDFQAVRQDDAGNVREMRGVFTAEFLALPLDQQIGRLEALAALAAIAPQGDGFQQFANRFALYIADGLRKAEFGQERLAEGVVIHLDE